MISDHELAAELASTAGQVLLTLRAEHLAGGGAADRSLAQAGDRAAQAHLAQALAEQRGGDAVLSEEAADDLARLQAERVWIIDPLDGTREYSEDRHDWAVHVALWERGELAAGAVALPGLDLTLSTGAPLPPARASADPIRMAVSRSRATELVTSVAASTNAELVPMGSAGYKAAAVIRGEADAYLHTGGQYEWDSAAPVAVARSAGLHTSRIDGTPLEYNRPNPYLPDLLICQPDIANQLLTLIAETGGETVRSAG